MKNILLLLICLLFFGCATTFKGANGEDGKPEEDGKHGNEQTDIFTDFYINESKIKVKLLYIKSNTVKFA